MGCILRNASAVSSEQDAVLEVMKDAVSRPGTGLPEAFGVHIMPQHASDTRHGAVGFHVCSAGFRSCFGLFLYSVPFGKYI